MLEKAWFEEAARRLETRVNALLSQFDGAGEIRCTIEPCPDREGSLHLNVESTNLTKSFHLWNSGEEVTEEAIERVFDQFASVFEALLTGSGEIEIGAGVIIISFGEPPMQPPEWNPSFNPN